MQDCRVLIVVENGNPTISGENVSLVELATLSGFMEEMCGYEAYKRGMSMEDIKSNMLDVHLSAMRSLEKHIRKERRDAK